jgi:hypothetical protein
MLVIGLLLYINAFVCIGLLAWQIWCARRSGTTIIDQAAAFWVICCCWLLIAGTFHIFKFSFGAMGYRLQQSFEHILRFGAMSFMTLILINTLFTFRDPGTEALSSASFSASSC